MPADIVSGGVAPNGPRGDKVVPLDSACRFAGCCWLLGALSFTGNSRARTDAVPKIDPFQKLCELQKRWRELMVVTSREDIRSRIRDIICKGV